MKYDIDHFEKKLQNTPEELLCIGQLVNEYGQHCFNGLCNEQERIALKQLFDFITVSTKDGQLIYDNEVYSNKAACVNNGYSKEYQQETIRERLEAAFLDIKAAQVLLEAERILNTEVALWKQE